MGVLKYPTNPKEDKNKKRQREDKINKNCSINIRQFLRW